MPRKCDQKPLPDLPSSASNTSEEAEEDSLRTNSSLDVSVVLNQEPATLIPQALGKEEFCYVPSTPDEESSVHGFVSSDAKKYVKRKSDSTQLRSLYEIGQDGVEGQRHRDKSQEKRTQKSNQKQDWKTEGKAFHITL